MEDSAAGELCSVSIRTWARPKWIHFVDLCLGGQSKLIFQEGMFIPGRRHDHIHAHLKITGIDFF